MQYVHDKTKALFNTVKDGFDHLKKVKVLAFSLLETSDSVVTHYAIPDSKLPTHYLIDQEKILKTAYNTTNIFKDTKYKWTSFATSFEERIISDVITPTSHDIEIFERRIDKGETDSLLAEKIVLYTSNESYDDFVKKIEQSESALNFHYLIDDKKCYELVPRDLVCHHMNHNDYEKTISIVILTRSRIDIAKDRAIKLIRQIQKDTQITTYENIKTYEAEHVYSLTDDFFNEIEEGMPVTVPSQSDEQPLPTTAQSDTNPGNHIIHVRVLFPSYTTYADLEKRLIQFLGDWLIYHELTTASLYRINDLLASGDYCAYYNRLEDFKKLVDAIDHYIKELQSGNNMPEITATGIPIIDPTTSRPYYFPFEPDQKPLDETAFFMTSDTKSLDEDYIAATVEGVIQHSSRFEDAAGSFSTAMPYSGFLYEPIYPDLTVPPRNTTLFYNKNLLSPKEILKELETPYKPVIGKIANLFDPYPVDEKIAQLEMHTPIVTMEYENSSDVNTNANHFFMSRFSATEKRLVALENILATQMRYLNRLSSRININCVYYGGQSPFDKYQCIRCLKDDLVQDAAIVSLDQCLNCSRYEPILGQFYEIIREDMKPNMAQLYDDVQASHMTRNEFASFNSISDYTKSLELPTTDLTKLHMQYTADEDYDDLLKSGSHFMMNWSETSFDKQSPHINIYEYDPNKMYLNKAEAIATPYEDGFKDVKQKAFERPVYSLNSLGSGNFDSNMTSVSYGGYHLIGDFNLDPDDVRHRMMSDCEEMVKLAKEGKCLYTLGAYIKPEYTHLSPLELYDLIVQGKTVNNYSIAAERSKDDKNLKALYYDCSAFVSHMYQRAGLLKERLTSSGFASNTNFKLISNNGKSLKEMAKEAIPGDIFLFSGHVSIYAGGDEEYEASGDGETANPVPITKQCGKNKLYNTDRFKGILRHKQLAMPKLKNIQYANVTVTLDEFVGIQVTTNPKNNTKTGGKDNAYTTDREYIRKYIDPSLRMTPELKMQFFSPLSKGVPGMYTVDSINAFLNKKNSKITKMIQVDDQYNPVRDDKGNFVWVDNYQLPRAEIFIKAAEKSGLNIFFLMAIVGLEQGWCKSNFAHYSGKYMDSKGNYLLNPYSLWCYNDDPKRLKAKAKCEENGFFTIEKAIIDGAKYVAERYYGAESLSKHGRRDTIYFMRWHFANLIEGQNCSSKPATYQYATDVSWADQQAKIMYEALSYSPIGRDKALEGFDFIIPKFKG